MLWQAMDAALAASSHSQGKSTRNVSFRDLKIPWGWDFSYGKTLVSGAGWRGRVWREEQVKNQVLIPPGAEETSERQKNAGRGQKKVGTPLEQGGVEGDERGRKGISWQQLCRVCFSLCVSHRVCITAVPGMWSGRKETQSHYKNTQPSSEGVRESSGIKDVAEMVKCCWDRNSRALCSHQQPELGMKTRERFGREEESKKILYQA